MTLNAIAALAGDAVFQSQVRSAAVGYAHTVMAETPGAHYAQQSKRYALAASVLQDGGVSTLTRFVWGLASKSGFSAIPNDTGNANDAAINSAIITVWDDLALVTGADKAS